MLTLTRSTASTFCRLFSAANRSKLFRQCKDFQTGGFPTDPPLRAMCGAGTAELGAARETRCWEPQVLPQTATTAPKRKQPEQRLLPHAGRGTRTAQECVPPQNRAVPPSLWAPLRARPAPHSPFTASCASSPRSRLTGTAPLRRGVGDRLRREPERVGRGLGAAPAAGGPRRQGRPPPAARSPQPGPRRPGIAAPGAPFPPESVGLGPRRGALGLWPPKIIPDLSHSSPKNPSGCAARGSPLAPTDTLSKLRFLHADAFCYVLLTLTPRIVSSVSYGKMMSSRIQLYSTIMRFCSFPKYLVWALLQK